MTSPDVTAQREVEKSGFYFGKNPIQTVKMVQKISQKLYPDLCLFNFNTFCGGGGNCILKSNSPNEDIKSISNII